MKGAMDTILVTAILFGGLFRLVLSNAPPVFHNDWSIVLSKSENDPIGTTIKTFSVTDPDNDYVYLSAVDADTQEFFTITPSTGRGNLTASIVISKALDCDPPRKSLISVHIRVTDRTNGEGNTVDTKSHFQIVDVNDEIPKFTSAQFSWTINENTRDIEDFLVAATDNDQSLRFYSIKFTLHPNTQSSGVADEYMKTFEIITNQNNRTAVARIRLLKPLDFETNTYYSFKINATDNSGSGNTVSNDFVIRVQDVQDTAPVFTRALYRTTVPENITQGYTILVVSAMDGDFGNPRKINYNILEGPCSSLFQIDSVGRISTKTILETDDIPESRICQLTVEAFEVVPGLESATDETRSTTDVWITILDSHGENPANCNNNGNINYISLTTMWVAILVGNV